jgi:hypothetical protein
VSLVPFQTLDRGERPIDLVLQFVDVDVTKVVRGERGQETQTDVGRRRTVRDGLLRADLNVVRWEKMTIRVHERVEVRPGLPGDSVQVLAVGRRQRRPALRNRATEREGEERRRCPEREQGAGRG